MIFDALESLPGTLEADVAVAGAGPAGIVLALELARQGRSVVLLEGGAADSPGDGFDLYQGSNDGRAYPLTGSRLRWLGGTSNHWGGWVRPFDPIDFEDHRESPLPGWPIDAAALEKGYERAADWCEVSSSDYRPVDGEFLDLEGTGFRNALFRFSPPTRFGSRYAPDLESDDAIQCWTNLNAVELVQREDAVDELTARTLAGEECTVRASFFVVAMGGVENARFLLNQDRVPGNQSGLVGRCFMDHYGFTPGLLLSRSGLQYERGQVAGDDVMMVMAPTPEQIRERGVPNTCFLLTAQSPDAVLPPRYWTSPVTGGSEGINYRINMINAPLPHPESAITLTDERDRLGMRRPHLHWHLPDSAFDAPIALFQDWTRAMSARGLGRIRWQRRSAPTAEQRVGVGYHHMGTTRMSASPDYGVVDPEGRVWDRDNLYVAGSSLFPAVGYANPTLSIVALAVRQAEHISQRLEARS
jgi:hypothetical protein